MTDHPNRYADHWSRGDLVICRDCTSRASVVAIPRDEIAQHDAWHDAEEVAR